MGVSQQSIPPAPETQRLARQVHDLTADLMTPDRRLYWLDLAVTSLVTYASLFAAVAADLPGAVRWAAGVVCVFALYRAISFIHELTHLRADDAPGFKAAWNILIGVPFLAPSFLYEGVHTLHHAKDRYGTARDPEYLPLARYRAGKIVLFAISAVAAPLAMLVRFAVVTPLSFAWPPLRRFAIARLSAMTINPVFAREDLATSAAWRAQEIGCWLWSWTLIAAAAGGLLSPRWLIALAILCAVTFVNQLRTLGAHAWSNDGGRMSFEDQFRDSVNVPPPALLPALWAPVGLRYHALHHLAPRLPYHALGAAHRRLFAALPAESPYHGVAQPNLSRALRDLLARARAHGA